MTFSSYHYHVSCYAINNCNNHFTIQDLSSSEIYTIDISNGNYYTQFNSFEYSFDTSDNQIITTINERLNTLGLASDLSVSISTLTGKFSFLNQSANNYLINFVNDKNNNFNSNPLPFNIGWMMGFRLGQYIIDPSSNLQSEGIIDFIYPKFFFIRIDDFTEKSSNSYIANFSESILSNQIIGRINYAYDLFENGSFNIGSGNINSTRYFSGPVNINKFHIQLIDEFGRIVDLNNMDWALEIELTMLYD